MTVEHPAYPGHAMVVTTHRDYSLPLWSVLEKKRELAQLYQVATRTVNCIVDNTMARFAGKGQTTDLRN